MNSFKKVSKVLMFGLIAAQAGSVCASEGTVTSGVKQSFEKVKDGVKNLFNGKASKSVAEGVTKAASTPRWKSVWGAIWTNRNYSGSWQSVKDVCWNDRSITGDTKAVLNGVKNKAVQFKTAFTAYDYTGKFQAARQYAKENPVKIVAGTAGAAVAIAAVGYLSYRTIVWLKERNKKNAEKFVDNFSLTNN